MKSFTDQKKIEILNIALLTAFAVMTVLQLLVAFVPAVAKLFTAITANVIVSQAFTIAPFIFFFVYCGINVPKEIKVVKMRAGDVMLTILLAFLLQPVLRFFNALSLVFTENETTGLVLGLMKQLPFLPALLLTALLPAVVEETVFRGAVYRTYRKASPTRAIIFSALLFGLFHGNLNQFFYAVVLGIVFCCLVEASGSIVSSMIVHFITNALSVCAVYALPAAYETMKEATDSYRKLGMTEMVEYVESLMGDMTLPADEWLTQLLSQSESVNLSIGMVFMNFFPSAVIFGLLSALVIRAIARRNGNWNRFRVTFLGADAVPIEKMPTGPYDKEVMVEGEETEGDLSLRILTVPLMVALAIGAVMMFVYETLKMLPRTK